MAGSFFGEIVEPTSRAFIDFGDEDLDDASSLPSIEFVLAPKTADLSKYKLVLVFHGAIARAYAEHNVVRGEKPCGSVKRTEGTNEREVAKLFALDKDTLCCNATWVADVDSISFVECISQIIKNATRVVIICSQTASKFMSDKIVGDGLLRCLTVCSKLEEIGVKCTKLEQPNFISGVPAAVMTFCQLEKISACLFVCYSDEDPGVVDSRTFAPFGALSASPLLSKFLKTGHKAMLSNSSFGNIYM